MSCAIVIPCIFILVSGFNTKSGSNISKYFACFRSAFWVNGDNWRAVAIFNDGQNFMD